MKDEPGKKFADYAAERAQQATPDEAAAIGVFDAIYARNSPTRDCCDSRHMSTHEWHCGLSPDHPDYREEWKP